MATPDDSTHGIAEAEGAAATSKPKRVRTGCLTCRERHLKCDEALPTCLNCRKSARVCRRGLRLNFIDTQVKAPPVLSSGDEWRIEFHDESVMVAADYEGGIEQYGHQDHRNSQDLDHTMTYEYDNPPPAPNTDRHPSLPSIHGMFSQQSDQFQSNNIFDHPMTDETHSAYSSKSLPSHHSTHTPPSQYAPLLQQPSPQTHPGESKQWLDTQEETLYMQVFVEEVGLWMDSMDEKKHFSRILPFHALAQPMLLNAFLACGVRHLTLVNPAVYKEEKALKYYDIASSYLLQALKNPHRDSVICATTAVILNVYEIMTEKALTRMNHIAGARALIKECGWNARSDGIGAACFWINVGMELLSNLHFNWKASWHPDAWGLDLDLSPETQIGKEEVWTHRILYIIGKVSDFRATIPRQQEVSERAESLRRQKRMEEWINIKQLADTWNANCPRTMQPLAYLYPYQTHSRSCFPEVWLIKRTTIIARLFYHTCMCLLAQINPTMSREVPEMHQMEQYHAHMICGIVAHVKDRQDTPKFPNLLFED